MQLLQRELHLVQELHRSPQDLPPLVYLDAVELLLQGQDLRPLGGRLGKLALGQGQTVPGLESVSCPLKGPEAVKEEDIEGDEDDEAGGQESEVRSQVTNAPTSRAPTQPHPEGAPQLPLFSEEETKTQRG